MTTISQDGEWFCLQCNDVLNPIDVTYQERCSLCGSKAQWVFENPIYGSGVYLSMKKRAEQAESERDELKRRVEELESFLDWIERDEMWDKTWRQIRSEWKEAGE